MCFGESTPAPPPPPVAKAEPVKRMAQSGIREGSTSDRKRARLAAGQGQTNKGSLAATETAVTTKTLLG